ncbi:MAG: hypothetical protein PHI85_10165 [Victivallaceae bacterium]|nr:hypothetical protein [Victivallaceae bacterium]
MNYFRILFDVCRGVKRFPELADRSIWPAMWRFVLTCILCSAVIGMFQYPRLMKLYRASHGMVEQEFGNLVANADGGLTVAKSPDKARAILLPGGFSACYIPDVVPGTALPDYAENAIGGLIFSPRHILLWMGDTLMTESNPGATRLRNAENIRELLERPAVELPPEMRFSNMLANAVSHPKTMLFSGALIFLLVQTVPVVVLFSLVFGWFGSFRSAGILTLRDVFVIDFYAAMPVMLAAALFPALDLPYIDFNLVFSVGFVGYAMIACNHVAMTRLPRRSKEE